MIKDNTTQIQNSKKNIPKVTKANISSQSLYSYEIKDMYSSTEGEPEYIKVNITPEIMETLIAYLQFSFSETTFQKHKKFLSLRPFDIFTILKEMYRVEKISLNIVELVDKYSVTMINERDDEVFSSIEPTEILYSIHLDANWNIWSDHSNEVLTTFKFLQKTKLTDLLHKIADEKYQEFIEFHQI
ncbi:hypothetical protein [Bacillus pseudomycoides]|uniref:hypothetical protein n=1 Tax=Bacillus pseudomycoides TaxID=64104 RepID=UPI000BF0F868|nr:hypothetical protein [Bacillus pseudomycoides]PEN08623.1 hypothetical protein CN640_13390 [Bacillus pseudomycoides]